MECAGRVTYADPYQFALECAKKWQTREDRWQCALFLRVISNYMAAVCEREREHMPVVGIAKDRQVLRMLNGILSSVRSMMCFGCAQIHANVPLWEKMYEPGQHGQHTYQAKERDEESVWNEHDHCAHVSQSMIKMYSIDESLEKSYNRSNDSFRQHFN